MNDHTNSNRTAYKRVLTIQDISCVGQCSLTVALPILSACGVETAILPSAVLSTHTGGFTGYTFRDLTEDMPVIKKHWEKEGILFDAIYSGYLGSVTQINYVREFFETMGKEGCVRVMDPAMADNGKLYYGFDQAFVAEMAKLVKSADIVLPNITEASFMTGMEYKETYDEAYIRELNERLFDLGAKTVVLTGVSFEEGFTGVMVASRDEAGTIKEDYYRHKRIPVSSHGTGDVFASAFTGALMRGYDAFEAASIAADYVVCSIENTITDPSHWYGVRFELALPELIHRLNA